MTSPFTRTHLGSVLKLVMLTLGKFVECSNRTTHVRRGKVSESWDAGRFKTEIIAEKQKTTRPRIPKSLRTQKMDIHEDEEVNKKDDVDKNARRGVVHARIGGRFRRPRANQHVQEEKRGLTL